MPTPDLSPVPAVTRDQVVGLIRATIYHSRWTEEGIENAADAVMALLAEAPQPKVLCEGWVVDSGGGHVSLLVDRLTDRYPAEGRARVAVVALGPPVPEAPEGGSDAG